MQLRVTPASHLFGLHLPSASTLVDEGVSPDAATHSQHGGGRRDIIVKPPPQSRMLSSADEHRSMAVSFWKAEQLLALATLVAARHAGVTLDDVIERFSVSKRTAQRMLRALEAQFTDTNVSTDGEGRKRWHLPSGALRDLMSLSPEELAALDIAIETLKRSGLAVEADDLLSLREKILALVPTVEGRPPRDRPRGPARGAGAGCAAGPTPAHRPQDRCCRCRGHQGLSHPGGRVPVARRAGAAYAAAGTLRSAYGIATLPARPPRRRPDRPCPVEVPLPLRQMVGKHQRPLTRACTHKQRSRFNSVSLHCVVCCSAEVASDGMPCGREVTASGRRCA